MAEKASRHDALLAVSARDSLRRETAHAVAQATAVRHLAPAPRPDRTARPRQAVLVPA
jgi:hypothetical protein